MKRHLGLLKVIIRINFSFTTTYTNGDWIQRVGIIGGILTFLGIAIAYFYKAFAHFYDIVQKFGVESMMLAATIVIGSAFSILITGFMLVNFLYLSRDYEALSYLPYRGGEIILAKFKTTNIIQLIIQFLLSIPILAVYIKNGSITFTNILLYYICLLLSIMTAIGALEIFFLIITKIFQKMKLQKIDALLSILMLLILYAIGGYFLYHCIFRVDVFSQKSIVVILVEYLTELIWNFQGLSQYFGIIVANLVVIGTTYAISYFLFKGNLYRYGRDNKRKRKKYISFRSNNFLSTYIKKEAKIFFRQPSYIINGLFGIVITPFLLPLSFQISGINDGTTVIREIINNPNYYWETIGLAVIVIQITSSINVVSSTCISREGKQFWICKIIPVKSSVQTVAKILFSYSIMWVGILLNCLVLFFYFQYDIYATILVFIISSLFLYIWTIIGMLYDFLFPKLNWTNETEAVKQNLNVVFTIITNILITILLSYLVINVYKKGGGEIRIILLGIIALIGLLGAGLTKILLLFSNKLFNHFH